MVRGGGGARGRPDGSRRVRGLAAGGASLDFDTRSGGADPAAAAVRGASIGDVWRRACRGGRQRAGGQGRGGSRSTSCGGGVNPTHAVRERRRASARLRRSTVRL